MKSATGAGVRKRPWSLRCRSVFCRMHHSPTRSAYAVGRSMVRGPGMGHRDGAGPPGACFARSWLMLRPCWPVPVAAPDGFGGAGRRGCRVWSCWTKRGSAPQVIWNGGLLCPTATTLTPHSLPRSGFRSTFFLKGSTIGSTFGYRGGSAECRTSRMWAARGVLPGRTTHAERASRTGPTSDFARHTSAARQI